MNKSIVEDVRVPVVVNIASRKMSLDNVQRIKKGTILEFANTCNEPLEIKANNIRIGDGEALVVDQMLAVRVRDVVGAEGD